MVTITKPIDCELREYNIDLGDRFGDGTVYVKVPMRFEDFGKEEKAMLLTQNYIRERIVFVTNLDPSTMLYTIEASFQLSPDQPKLKASGGIVPILDPDANAKRLCDYKEKLIDVLINKVQTYYEVRDIKEDTNMPVRLERLSDKTLKAMMFGAFPNDDTANPQTKSRWIEGLPAVKKVETYNDRVVKVTFIDDTFTKAICSENDHFDLDVGITICAMKRIFGEHGTREYNRFIEHAHDVMARNEKKKEAEKAAKEVERTKRRKAELKKAAKELKAKEAYIDMHKEAYLRAMKEYEEDDLK